MGVSPSGDSRRCENHPTLANVLNAVQSKHDYAKYSGVAQHTARRDASPPQARRLHSFGGQNMSLHFPNAIHLHLILNHAPVFGELFAAVLLLAAAVLRSTTLLRTALAVVILTALGAIPVFFTGRAAADAIGKVEGIDQEAIGPHEEAAERFLIAASAAGVAAVVALVWPRRLTIALVSVLTILSFGLAGWTANRGALIHHQELRPPVTVQGAS